MGFIVSEEDAGVRLDVILSERADISRSQVQKLISDLRVEVDGEVVEKNSFLVSTGMKISFEEAAPREVLGNIQAEDISLDIIYEDGDLLVINKPAGMVVHPGAGVPSGTVANAVAYYLKGKTEGLDPLRPGIIHRLDRDTSGLLIIAKNVKVQALISAMFEKRELQKKYLALVIGSGLPKEGTIDSPIARHPTFRTKMAVSNKPTARSALTHFDVLSFTDEYSLVDIRLITGRTHQIRVHFSAISHPVVGDCVYGNEKVNKRFKEEFGLGRQFLHAYQLSFTHPITQEKIELTAPLPKDLQKTLDKLRLSRL